MNSSDTNTTNLNTDAAWNETPWNETQALAAKRRAKIEKVLGRFPNGVRPEYPRPDFVRGDKNSWRSLNGVWSACFDGYRQGDRLAWQNGLPSRYAFPIVVPFAYQWELSGVAKQGIQELLWYERAFQVPADWRDGDNDVLLHFGAVDYRCLAWLNGQEIGGNEGGHVPFSFDVTPYLRDGDNRLTLRVEDAQDPHQPRGKQVVSGVAQGVDYTNTSGIWQSVWLERAPAQRIESLRLTPRAAQNPAQDALQVEVFLHAPALDWRVTVEVFDGLPENGATPEPIMRTELETLGASASGRVALPHAPRWSPQNPRLLGLRVTLRRDDDDKIVDEVLSYAGLRSVGVKRDGLYLNGERTFLATVLDQGYWPDGGLTAPSDEALRADVEWCLKFGFNGARKHQKVEDPRWLYWCDRLGLLVWGEMANARALSAQSEAWFLGEWERVVRRDYNHPCIVTWVPHNETWGLPSLKDFEQGSEYAFIERTVNLTRRLDPSRPVVDNDGWQHSDVSDVATIHDYASTGDKLRAHFQEFLEGGELPKLAGNSSYGVFAKGAKYRGQPIMLSEVGGYFLLPADLPENRRDSLYDLYGNLHSSEELLARYRDLMQGIAALPFVSGFCYTQLTDVQQEVNGLLSFERAPKIAPEAVAAVHRELFNVHVASNL